MARVRRDAPLNAADAAAPANLPLPENLAATIRIDRVHEAGLLTGDERAFAAAQAHQDGRRPEIEVRSIRHGAVGLDCIRKIAVDGERIAAGHLTRPEQFPGL